MILWGKKGANFNPRSREGSDQAKTLPEHTLKFQSTLPRGERLARLESNLFFLIFQSTLPRGERHRTG